MDPEKIEGILDKHFQADEPEGMRERVLNRASRELRPVKSRKWSFTRFAFAGVLILILLANISDVTRTTRLARAGGNQHGAYSKHVAKAAAERHKLTQEMLAWSGSGRIDRKSRRTL